MVGEYLSVIHLVDMVAGQDQDVVRFVRAQDVEILVHRVGCTEIPVLFRNALRGGQDVDELLEAAVEETPAALDVPDQTVGLVLRRHADAPDPGIHAIRQGKIDDAELAAKRHGRFGAPVGQVFQPAATPAGQHECIGILGQQADEADIGVVVDHEGFLMQTLNDRARALQPRRLLPQRRLPAHAADFPAGMKESPEPEASAYNRGDVARRHEFPDRT